MISKLLSGLMIATGVVPIGVAMAAICGLGLLREAGAIPLVMGPMAVVLLPCLGLATLFNTRPMGLALILWVWPILVLIGLPAYFPGERSEALTTGLGVVASLHSPESAVAAADFGSNLATWLGPEPETVHEPATPIQTEPEDPGPPPRPPESLKNDQVALPYEGEGRTLRIPVAFENGFGESIETWMLFDTGATFTTLDLQTLKALDIEVSPSAPQVTLHTANGERTAQLVLLEQVWLGGFPVKGVTVAVCEACASPETGVTGLLGNNVSGQFTVTLDPDRQEMVLEPRKDSADRHLDVSPWVDIDAKAHLWPDGRVEVEVEASNQGSRVVEEAHIGIRCAEDHFKATLNRIYPGDLRRSRVSLPRGTQCENYQVSLDAARW